MRSLIQAVYRFRDTALVAEKAKTKLQFVAGSRPSTCSIATINRCDDSMFYQASSAIALKSNMHRPAGMTELC
jgi:hypothetical protein